MNILKVHFIWIGGILPEEESENIRGWLELNSGYEFNLWYDSRLTKISHDIYQQMIGSDIILRDITLYNFFRNRQLKFAYETEIGLVKRKIYNLNPPLVNYGFATDILRLLILKRYKGFYIDVDIMPVDLSTVKICGLRFCFGQIDNTLSNASIYYDGSKDSTKALNELLRNLISYIKEFYQNRQVEYPFNWENDTLSTTGPIAINKGLQDYGRFLFENNIFIEEEKLGREHNWFIRLSRFLDLFIYIYKHPEVENKIREKLLNEIKDKLFSVLNINPTDQVSVGKFNKGKLEALLDQDDLEDEDFVNDVYKLYDEYLKNIDKGSNILYDIFTEKLAWSLSRDNKDKANIILDQLRKTIHFDILDENNKDDILHEVEKITEKYLNQ